MDKMEAHLRQQLSAMMDGELASDEARFLFRRLQHDRDLAGCWERWQVCSVLLRGQGTNVLLPADFSQRVAREVASHTSHSILDAGQSVAATGMHSRHWAWWGGGALAASLALLAVVPRPASGPASAKPATADRSVATTTPGSANPVVPSSPSLDAGRAPAPPPAAAQLATALAVAEAPRRLAARRHRAITPEAERVQPQAPRSAESGSRLATAEPEPLNLPNRGNPFKAQQAVEARPWPRAVVPGAATGAFTASYSTGATSSFYPFEPRNLSVPEAQAPADEGAQP